MSAELVIMGVKGSPFVRKVQVVLAEKGVDYEIEQVMPFPPPDWYVEINPAKRIPTLRDRSVGSEGVAGTIPDSSAICAYVEHKHPEPSLYPKEAFAYGRALWFEEFADTELSNRVGGGFFRPLVMSALMGKERDVETARVVLAEQMPQLFDYFEKSVAGREYLVGDAFSIADVSVASQFINYFLAGGPIDAGRWPSLAAYVERMHARPSFAACWEAERKLFPPVDVEL